MPIFTPSLEKPGVLPSWLLLGINRGPGRNPVWTSKKRPFSYWEVETGSSAVMERDCKAGRPDFALSCRALVPTRLCHRVPAIILPGSLGPEGQRQWLKEQVL